jgi:hypothetical protein
MICTSRHILLVWSNRGGLPGRFYRTSGSNPEQKFNELGGKLDVAQVKGINELA